MSKQQTHATVASYTTGFVLSIILTLAAYIVVTKDLLEGTYLLLGLAVLAVAQLIVQLLYFLHLGESAKPRWTQLTFGFMVFAVLILVVGTLWIMENLDYHGQTPEQTEQELLDRYDEGGF